MKRVAFNKEKSKQIKKERGVSFEEIAKVITKEGFVGIISHPNKSKYPNQRMFLVNLEEYIFVVPFVEDDEKIFLKTIYPSRKYTQKYFNK